MRLLARISRLGLSLVPTHPDRTGGLGFVERLPAGFAPVSLAISSVLASRWAHLMLHHGQSLSALKLHALTFVIVWFLLLVAPLVPLVPILFTSRRAALGSYSAMVAEQGRLVHKRWIDGAMKSDAPLLEPTGVGVIGDAAAMFKAVASMRSVPIGMTAIAGIVLPIAIPMVVVASLQMPVKDLLLGLVKALV